MGIATLFRSNALRYYKSVSTVSMKLSDSGFCYQRTDTDLLLPTTAVCLLPSTSSVVLTILSEYQHQLHPITVVPSYRFNEKILTRTRARRRFRPALLVQVLQLRPALHLLNHSFGPHPTLRISAN